jgi:oligopeptide/dipeptide ABC transporter ATP-binding protein
MLKEMDAILSIQNLRIHFFTYRGVIKAVDGISLRINKGEILGLIGETGCGKSVTGLSAMRLIESPGKIVSGRILFEGEDLLAKTESEMRSLRGSQISMIVQDPLSSLNPVYKIGEQIAESIRKHQNIEDKIAVEKALNILDDVRIPNPRGVMNRYPHELSGGMLQRVIIAIAICSGPKLIIADEATSALDVTIQAQILKLLKDLNLQLGTSILMITHDFGVLAHTCNSAAVMYAGHIVETASTVEILRAPHHPYAKGLINAIPSKKEHKLRTIKGKVPNLAYPPKGCIFHPRCDWVKKICLQEKPELFDLGNKHEVACFLYH